MIRIITVPHDLTADADRAMGPASVLARQLGASLELAAVSSLDPAADGYELQARAEQVTAIPTSTVVVSDPDPVHALATLAEDHDRLVCMGSHGGRLREVVSPSMALSLVRNAHRPVVAVGPQLQWWPGPLRSLFVGVDERGVPESTLELVDEWASALAAEVCLVHALAPDQPDSLPARGALAPDAANAWLAERGRRSSVRRLVGDPTMMLADTADRANRQSPLLVVTTRVDTRRDRVLHGSVAGRLIAIATVPVAVVPATVSSDGAHEAHGLIVSGPRVGT